MSAICVNNRGSLSTGLLAAGALLTVAVLVTAATVLPLHYCGICRLPIPAYYFIGMESALLVVGIALLALGFHLKKRPLEPTLPLQEEEAVLNTPIPITQLIAPDAPAGGLSETLSSHWLKNAATRIFHKPLRSFLELVVNGLDASLSPEKSVGKFGMGFISILSFLDHPETKGCTLEIETTYQKDDRSLCSYSMDLFKQQEAYQILFNERDAEQQTGTTITLLPKQASFSEETLKTLFAYCQTLQFYEHGKIEVTYQGKTYTIGSGEKVLVWVTLEGHRIRVQDKGLGISKEVARTKLVVPSASTKQPHPAKDNSIRLPELKAYQGKRDQTPHFLLVINGVLVMDLTLEGQTGDDLLVRLPSSTRLTLARDAVENHPETISYLKAMIGATLEHALKSPQGATVLQALYHGLKTWEELYPAMKEARLTAHLLHSVHQIWSTYPGLIPYPIEYKDTLDPLLPADKKCIPFSSELLFNHFDSFENAFVSYHATHRKDLVASKTVVFVKGVEKVSAFGLKNVVLAPLSLLEKYPSDELLKLALVTQFADDGKFLSTSLQEKGPHAPSSLALMRAPKKFIFMTGREKPPTLEDRVPLRSQLFKTFGDEPFEQFWLKNGRRVFPEFGNITSPSNDYQRMPQFVTRVDVFLRWAAVAEYIGVQGEKSVREVMESLLISDDGLDYWRITDVEGAVAYILQPHYRGSSSDYLQFREKFFTSVSSAQVSKYFFEWLFAQAGVSETGGSIFTTDERLWPQTFLTVESLELCTHIFFKDSSRCRKQIASSCVPSVQEQEGIWKELETFMDYPDGELAVQALLPLMLLQKAMAQKGLSETNREKLNLFTKQLLSMHHRFFTIKLGEFTATYGNRPKRFEACSKQVLLDCSVKEIVDLLTSLKDKPHLFEKCLDLYLKEMSSRLDIKKRNEILPTYRAVYVEDICYHNTLVFLSQLKSRGIDQAAIELIVQYVRSPMELYTITLLLISEEIPEALYHPQNREKMLHLLKHIITVYIQGKSDLRAQHAFYDALDHQPASISRVKQIFNPVLEPLIEYLTTFERNTFETDTDMIPQAIVKKLENAKEFTTIQVIHTAKKGEAFVQTLQAGELEPAIEKVRQAPKETDLQMVTQAVEHGSERTYVAATLMEAFQNSADAIRSYLRHHPDAPQNKSQISFDVRFVDKQNPQLLLEIGDQIGMQSLETLLADFLIPNYSKKGKQTDAVGEMGNGSYQMYREADMVTVKTRTLDNPSRVYFLRIFPIRDPRSGEVVDLSHKCVDITDLEPQFIGTTLRVRLKKEAQATKTALELEGTSVRAFIKETFSVATPVLGENHTLQCQLKMPKESLTLQAFDTTHHPFTLSSFPFSCCKLKEDHKPGWVLTDGYPFKSLEAFLIEERILPAHLAKEVAYGWCLNLPKGSYTPVQSRSRVQLTKETKEQLQSFLLEWIYFRSSVEETTGPAARYYPHFQSVADFDQVYPYVPEIPNLEQAVLNQGDFRTLEAFFVHYKPAFLHMNFLDSINQGYKVLATPLSECRDRCLHALNTELTPTNRDKKYSELVIKFTQECTRLESEWKKSLKAANGKEQKFFEQVLIPWFAYKIHYFIHVIPSLNTCIQNLPQLRSAQEVADIEKLKSTYPDVNHALVKTATSILTHYCTLYAKTIPIAHGTPTVRLIYNQANHASAYYTHSTHEIVVNLAHISLASILEMGQKIASGHPIEHDPLISISYRSSGTLNHELEHARRGCDCTKNGHGHSQNAEGEYVDFEACAGSYAKKAHLAGLFVEWSQLLKGMTFPGSTLLAQVQKVEKDHPELLASLFVNPK